MEKVVFDLSRVLIENGHNVSVLCPSFLAGFYRETGARIIGIPLLDRTIGELVAAFALSLIGSNYDIIHVHGEGSCIVRALARTCRSKTIVTLHGGEVIYFTQKRGLYSLFMRACIILAASCASRITAVSNAVARRFPGFESKLSVVPNGINVENVRLIANQHRHEATLLTQAKRQGAVCLFFPGRLVAEQKGQDVALRSIATLTRQGFDVRLFLAGAGEDQRYLENLAKELAVENRVRFLGHLSIEKTLGYMACADIVLTHLAADARFAGLSQVHLEAAALSKPIVTVFRDDLAIFRGTMFFANAGKLEEVSWRISQIINDRDKAEAVAAKAMALVEHHFSWKTVVNSYLSIYRRALTI
jgi:glycosyltransferase involved in cell wall biosynthesis